MRNQKQNKSRHTGIWELYRSAHQVFGNQRSYATRLRLAQTLICTSRAVLNILSELETATINRFDPKTHFRLGIFFSPNSLSWQSIIVNCFGA